MWTRCRRHRCWLTYEPIHPADLWSCSVAFSVHLLHKNHPVWVKYLSKLRTLTQWPPTDQHWSNSNPKPLSTNRLTWPITMNMSAIRRVVYHSSVIVNCNRSFRRANNRARSNWLSINKNGVRVYLLSFWNMSNFSHPTLLMSFGWDTNIHRSLLPGVYARGSKCVPVMD